ncbi:MAG TPA: PadR family transcriptional regulator [Thermoanaerobaculia bacterium]|jgi:transcriptional regulator|nr:PadR family transcriptional regulator [Thermoanaerobaculia bacterium]
MAIRDLDRELKKGSAELLILTLLEKRSRHGYEIGKLIDTRSQGALRYNVASLYPLLYRLEAKGLLEGRWVEKPSQRRRRYYRLTAAGRQALRERRGAWSAFVEAMHRITEAEHA